MTVWNYAVIPTEVAAFWTGEAFGTTVLSGAAISTSELSAGRFGVGFSAGAGKTLSVGAYVDSGSGSEAGAPALVVDVAGLRYADQPGEFVIDAIQSHQGQEGLVLDRLEARWTQKAVVDGSVHDAQGCVRFTGLTRDAGPKNTGP